MQHFLNIPCRLAAALFVIVIQFALYADNDKKISLSAAFDYTVYNFYRQSFKYKDQIIWGDYRSVDRAWFHRITGTTNLRANLPGDFRFKIGFRAGIPKISEYLNTNTSIKNKTPSRISKASGISECFLAFDRDRIKILAGLFEYRYNPESRNLGEYLLLSGTYPGYIFSGRELVNFGGVHLRLQLVENFIQDVFVTTEIYNIPLWDLSLSYIGAYTLGEDVATIGAGVCFNRLVPIMPDHTTPEPQSAGDSTAVFSHQGIKLMLRGSIDFRKLVGGPALLGPEDLKVYAEAAVLGVKDYFYYYDDISERIPVMAGFNVPAFGLLDYCSVEIEWYGSPHLNLSPDKVSHAIPQDKEMGTLDDIKWSVSVKRTVTPTLSLYGRVARDHIRLEDASGYVERIPRTIEPENWYLQCKARISF